MHKPIILASQSPFRKMQLQQLGVAFTSQSPEVDEREIENNWQGPLHDLPLHLASCKAEKIALHNPHSIVIGSDQMLIFKGQSFAKPSSKSECVERLLSLQGQTHELHTSLCVRNGIQQETATTIAKMTMRPLSLSQIEKYVELDQPIGCAGAYKIEEKGLLLFSQIETSDHSSIVGLPLLSLVSILSGWGISLL